MRSFLTQGLKKWVGNESQYAHGDRHARILAIATVKGGVGKTTTSVNLASGLARFGGKKVLLIDLDAQGHCCTSLSSQMPNRPVIKHSLSEILLGTQNQQVLDAIFSTTIPNLDMTLADATLAEAEGRLGQKIGKELLLREALSITRTHYDEIIIDCPPNKGNLTLNALLAADEVLIPTDLSPLSVQGADELLETVMTVRQRLHHPLDVLGVLCTRVDGRTSKMNDTIMSQVEEAWGALLFESSIGINTDLGKAQLAGEDIYTNAPNSRGAKDYETLVEEVLARRQ